VQPLLTPTEHGIDLHDVNDLSNSKQSSEHSQPVVHALAFFSHPRLASARPNRRTGCS
jgi:hypothetical protein